MSYHNESVQSQWIQVKRKLDLMNEETKKLRLEKENLENQLIQSSPQIRNWMETSSDSSFKYDNIKIVRVTKRENLTFDYLERIIPSLIRDREKAMYFIDKLKTSRNTKTDISFEINRK